MEKCTIRLPIELIALAVAVHQLGHAADFAHLCTFGSKDGIHPPKFSNRKAAVAATGSSEHPYGLGYPAAVTTDLEGRVWIADSGTGSVHVFGPATGEYQEIRKAGSLTLQRPAGITADAQGRIYLVDTDLANVFVFEQGKYDHTLLKSRDHLLTAPTVIAMAESGRVIYVADPPRNVIVALNREGEAEGLIPMTEATRNPAAIVTVNNQIYVLGAYRHKVGIFTPAGKPRGELRWQGVPVPTAMTFDRSTRRFLIGNPGAKVVEVFDEEGKSIGSFGAFGDQVDQYQRVEFLHVGGDGRVFVVDSHSGKVLVFAGRP